MFDVFLSFSRHQTGAMLVVFHSLFALFLAQQAAKILYFAFFSFRSSGEAVAVPMCHRVGTIPVSSFSSWSTLEQLLTDLQVQRIGQQQ